MELELSVPSKTFLLGEYLALTGGPALLLNTAPRFKLTVKNKVSIQSQKKFTPGSPAQKYIEKYFALFEPYELIFYDPYHCLGGLGASSAQFCLVYAFKNYLEHREIDYHELLSEYREISTNDGQYPPSGADIIAQMHGAIVYFHRKQRALKKLIWPFSDLIPILIRTKHKIATHHHLKNISRLNVEGLEKIVANGLNSLLNHNSQGFCRAINEYGNKLQEKNLILNQTLALLTKVKQQSSVEAAKGCGALGADVILVLVKNKNKSEFSAWASSEKIDVVTYNNVCNEGLTIKKIAPKNEHEKVILVNSDDQQIDLEDKLTAHKKGLLHRAFSVFIFRSHHNQIEVLLQQRAHDKYHSSNLWSNACCSHPLAGESILQNAQQRLQAEMGINVPLREIGVFRYKADCGNGLTEHEVDHVFIGKLENEAVNPNPSEASAYQWIAIAKLKAELAKHPQKYTPWLEEALNLIIDNHALEEYLHLKLDSSK